MIASLGLVVPSLLFALTVARPSERSQTELRPRRHMQPAKRDTSESILSFRTVKVATGIYAFITPEERTGLQSGNSIAVIGDSAVLVFDVGAIPASTRKMIATLRTLTTRPVRYVVNSHWHPDHTLANSEYRKAFPDVRFIGTRATQQGIVDRANGFMEQVAGFATTDSLMRLRLSTGKMRDGSAIPPTLRIMWDLTTRDYRDFHGEVAQATPLTVDSLIGDTLTIELGHRAVRLTAPGPGNTAGDTYAYVPDAKVLLTGDLVTVPCPFPSTAYFTEWIPVLDRLLATDASHIVPGHGDVQRDTRYIRQVRALVSFTLDKARDAVRRGISADSLAAELTFSEFLPRFAGTDVVRSEAFNNFYRGPAVQRAHLEATLAAKGQRLPPYPQ